MRESRGNGDFPPCGISLWSWLWTWFLHQAYLGASLEKRSSQGSNQGVKAGASTRTEAGAEPGVWAW